MANLHSKVFFRDKIIDFSEANLSIASSAVLYGLSTYTVFLVKNIKGNNYAFRLEDHYQRLVNSMKILGMKSSLASDGYKAFESKVVKLVKANNIHEDSLVRVVIFVDGILSGTTAKNVPASIAIFSYSKTPMLPTKGAKLMVSSFRRNSDLAIPARAKVSGGYVNVTLMKDEATASGYDDAIALDSEGHVTESTVSNIFLVKNNKLITPSGSSDILEGITRDSIIKLAEEIGIETELRTVDRSELYTADEAFLCGTSMDMVPVISIDGRKLKTNGLITKRLMEEFGNKITNDLDVWLKSL